jgi:hypothetical protein
MHPPTHIQTGGRAKTVQVLDVVCGWSIMLIIIIIIKALTTPLPLFLPSPPYTPHSQP